MLTAQFSDGQFVNGSVLTAAAALPTQSLEQHGAELHTPGLVAPSAITLAYAGLVVTAGVAGSGFLFGSGVLARGIGNTAGQTNSSYAADFTSLVPTAGNPNVEAYLVAAASVVQQSPVTVVGPPVGHPDYNPNFAAFTAYQQLVDSVTITATLTAPDNVTYLEIGRVQLAAGQTTITALDTSHRVLASAVLSPTGVAAATYANPITLVVGADGRVISLANGPASVQQGTGIEQAGDVVKIGWDGTSQLLATVDTTALGAFAFEAWVTAGFAPIGTSDIVVDGWKIYGDGLIEQWGQATLNATGSGSLVATGLVSFNITFPNAVFTVSFMPQSTATASLGSGVETTDGYAAAVGVSNLTTSGFMAHATFPGSVGSVTVGWIAKGH